jgi:hypothetical protein
MRSCSSATGWGSKMKGIATALAKAQANMGKALKRADNPHFRSKYADLGNVMDACLPALNEAGIALIQPTGENDHGRFVETILIHGESGESLTCRVPLIVSKNDMQGYGSAVTYARRYGLMAMAGIAPEDDDGNAAAKAPPKQEQRQQKPQETDAEAIQKACEYLSEADSLDDLKARWGRIPKPVAAIKDVITAKDSAKDRLSKPANADLGGDDLPY